VIRADLNCPLHLRDLAAIGEAAGREAIRLDRIVGEHDARAARHVERSAHAGRRAVSGLEMVLTGRTCDEADPHPAVAACFAEATP
jgi:hypothetical protein